MSYKAIVIILSEVKAKGVEEKKEAPDALIRAMLPAEEYEIESAEAVANICRHVDIFEAVYDQTYS